MTGCSLHHYARVLTPALQIIRLVNCAYVMTVVVAKISLSMFFLQLFGITHRWQKIYTYVAMALSTAFGLVFVGLILFSCGIQDPTILQADTCDIHVPYKALSLTWSFLNVLTDISFAILAVMLLWHTKLARWTKASSCALLIFGTLGGIASVLRITVQLIPLPQPLKVIITGRWSNIEGGTYITTASLATIRPLCRKACGFFRARPKRHSDDDHFVEYIHRTLSGGESTIEGGLVGGSKPVRPDIFRENSRDIFVTMEFGIDIEKRRSDSVVVPVPSNAMLNDTLYTV